jgi:hypothetical protein
MTRTARTHARDTGYTRKEMVLLFVGFLVFLSGVPGRSETWVIQVRTMARHLVQLVLVFLGLVTPVTPPAPAPHVRHMHVPAAPAPKPIPNSMSLRTDPLKHHYNYLFEGKATFHNKPCANASVLVRLTAGAETITKGAVTESDGSYTLKVGIDAEDNSSVDWTIEAYTADFNKVELSGRQIVQRGETEIEKQAPITVTNPVDFVISSAK